MFYTPNAFYKTSGFISDMVMDDFKDNLLGAGLGLATGGLIGGMVSDNPYTPLLMSLGLGAAGFATPNVLGHSSSSSTVLPFLGGAGATAGSFLLYRFLKNRGLVNKIINKFRSSGKFAETVSNVAHQTHVPAKPVAQNIIKNKATLNTVTTPVTGSFTRELIKPANLKIILKNGGLYV